MIITSFSEAGYEEYGKRFIEGFLEKWEDESLTVYVEGDATRGKIIRDFKEYGSGTLPSVRLTVFDLLKDQEFVKFAELLEKSDPLYSGKMRDPHSGKELYNFRYDANKFFRKVFAVTAYDRESGAWCETPGGMAENVADRAPFAWLDADIVFTRKVPKDFLNTCLAGHGLAYLGRPTLYSETGFMVFDPSYANHDLFMTLYRNAYLNGAFRLLTEWHDCQVFDFVREMLAYDGRNMAKGCDPNHPFVYSMLGTYMDHLKGPERKAAGRSKEVPRDAA